MPLPGVTVPLEEIEKHDPVVGRPDGPYQHPAPRSDTRQPLTAGARARSPPRRTAIGISPTRLPRLVPAERGSVRSLLRQPARKLASILRGAQPGYPARRAARSGPAGSDTPRVVSSCARAQPIVRQGPAIRAGGRRFVLRARAARPVEHHELRAAASRRFGRASYRGRAPGLPTRCLRDPLRRGARRALQPGSRLAALQARERPPERARKTVPVRVGPR